MSYFVSLFYTLCVAFCGRQLWLGGLSKEWRYLFALSLIFLLNSLHFGFIFLNEPEGALTNLGSILRFAFGQLPLEPSFSELVKFSVLRFVCVLLIGYIAYFMWRAKSDVLRFLKQPHLQNAFIAAAIFLSLSLIGIMTAVVFVYILSAIAWGAVLYFWFKSAP